ncbi:hypothetical protein [Rubellicoccus peritrichatus]|uniref:Uncharacterized protein n=1 Tax=Rubellicoccus peritrichatus TaxID=3080537 RepID=A0AAQ3LEI2_9BACT|nr:hypothetical protein [Puniceicoccus sp. CR14]WOO40376.1 hypothetical protein RZN69_17290 [Puniceicoccus sp. CR14]WOO40425.1 hypothetical protein RZN69_17535 [Puniceicoccus sp. CR14]WOO40474.1 hypothetical protein RZN69_17780 [Puniceicoccus sp. CR14]WOO40523.1 hypothetical protein RZN69_18025 [Puniceicoccus sp. CR14]
MSLPEHMEKVGSKGDPITAPYVMTRVCMAAPLVGEERAWSMPFGLLCWMTDSNVEAQGGELKFAPDDATLIEWDEQAKQAEETGRRLLAERQGKAFPNG